jgi:hypothetical protein
MDRPAANDRAACGQCRQFHKCHPSRHKNRFLFLREPHLLCGYFHTARPDNAKGHQES